MPALDHKKFRGTIWPTWRTRGVYTTQRISFQQDTSSPDWEVLELSHLSFRPRHSFPAKTQNWSSTENDGFLYASEWSNRILSRDKAKIGLSRDNFDQWNLWIRLLARPLRALFMTSLQYIRVSTMSYRNEWSFIRPAMSNVEFWPSITL